MSEGNRKQPPGSYGLPILGESLAFRDTHAFFEKRVAKYKTSLFKSHVLFRPAVFFVGPAAYTFFSERPSST